MTERHLSGSLEYLQERVGYLEESNQRFLSILEMLASSSEYQDDLSRATGSEGIFAATARQLLRLFPFHTVGFLDSESDGSFELAMTEPAEVHDSLKTLVEACMMDGTFAWALNRNQAILVTTKTGETLLLQAVATRSRVRGMCAAILPGISAVVDAASLNALSIVLSSCAYALESTTLYHLLRDHTQHLEERVQLRTQDLEEARLQAESASLAKSNFLANMSHEIRTPMNGVMGMTELMLQGGLSPEKEKKYLQAIKDSADGLMLIVNDILDFSKIEAGKFVLEQTPFNLRDVVERCLGGLIVRAEAKGLTVSQKVNADVPVCIIGDPGRLRQILTNLMGNAIKFCQNGRITVEAGIDSIEGDEVVLHVRVADTGIGISEEACQRIFEEFEQADSSTTRKFGGTGLGLAICKKLVELMNGTIWVESQQGVGSTFHFTARFLVGTEELPPLEHFGSVVDISASLAPLSILVADDVQINRVLVQEMLEPHGHRIISVEDGQKAIDAYASAHFDVVLMDVQMPEVDGLQAARSIRNYELTMGRTVPVPIFAMTAFAGNEDRQICLDAGMDDYLTKPIKSERLLQLLSKVSRRTAEAGEATLEDASALSVPNVPPPSETSEVEVFARRELLDRLGGRQELIPRFVELFCTGADVQIAGIAAALAERDADGVRRQAHGIKGAAGNIAALRLHQIAGDIEKIAKEDNFVEASRLFDVLQLEYRAFTETVAGSEGSAISAETEKDPCLMK
jgi:signal transduction histidine kinase/CheY-like chemotaxis protein/HPt (histidine-containing phosphotransfer) domain-containing protein